jgi:hypothetical protein
MIEEQASRELHANSTAMQDGLMPSQQHAVGGVDHRAGFAMSPLMISTMAPIIVLCKGSDLKWKPYGHS